MLSIISPSDINIKEGNITVITLQVNDNSSIITYEINGTNANLFNINSTTGKIVFKTAPIYQENNRTFAFNAIARNNDNKISIRPIDIHITILPSFEHPFLNEFNVSEGSAFVGRVLVNDDSDITYSLNGMDALAFNINSNTGDISFAISPVYDIQNVYAVTLVATDEEGNSITMDLSIHIVVVPRFVSPSNVSVREYRLYALKLIATDDSSISYDINGSDASYFDINVDTGIVTFKNTPVFADKSLYTFTGIARDMDGNVITTDIIVNITEDIYMRDLLNIQNNILSNNVRADILTTMNTIIANLEILLDENTLNVSKIQKELDKLHYYEHTFNNGNGLNALKISGTIANIGVELTPKNECYKTDGSGIKSSCNALFINVISLSSNTILGSSMLESNGSYSVYLNKSDNNVSVLYNIYTHFDGNKERYYLDFGNDNEIGGSGANADSFKFSGDINWSNNNEVLVSDINHLNINESKIINLDLSNINSSVYILKGRIKASSDNSNIDIVVMDIDTGFAYHTNKYIQSDENISFSFRLPNKNAHYSMKISQENPSSFVSMYLDDEKDVPTNSSDHIFDGDEKLVSGIDISWISRSLNVWVPDINKTGYFTISENVDIGNIDINTFGNNFHKIEGSVNIVDDFNISDKHNYITIAILDTNTGKQLSYSPVDNDYKYSALLGDSFSNEGYFIKISYSHYDYVNIENSYSKEFFLDFDDIDNGGFEFKKSENIKWVLNNGFYIPSNIHPFKYSGNDKIHNINIDFYNYVKPLTYDISGTISQIPNDAKWKNVTLFNLVRDYKMSTKLNTNNSFEFKDVIVGRYIIEVDYYIERNGKNKYYHYYIYDDDNDFNSGAKMISDREIKRYPFSADGSKIDRLLSKQRNFNWNSVAYWAPYDKSKIFIIKPTSDIKMNDLVAPVVEEYYLNIDLSNAKNNKNIKFNLFVPNTSIGKWETNQSSNDVVSVSLKDVKKQTYYLRVSIQDVGLYWFDSVKNKLVSDVYWVGKQNSDICSDWRNDIDTCNNDNDIIWTPNIDGFLINSDKILSLDIPNDRSRLSASLKLGSDYANKEVWVSMYEHNSNNYAWKNIKTNSNGNVDFNITTIKADNYRVDIYSNEDSFVVSHLLDANKHILITSQNSWKSDGDWGPKESTLIDMRNDLDLENLSPPDLSKVTLTITGLDTNSSNNISEDIYISIFKDNEWYGKSNAIYGNWPDITYRDKVEIKVPNGSYQMMIHPSSHKSGLIHNDNNISNEILSNTINKFNWNWDNADNVSISQDTSYTIALPNNESLKSISGVVNLGNGDIENGWISVRNANGGNGAIVSNDGSFKIKGLEVGKNYTLRYWAWNNDKSRITEYNINISKDIEGYKLNKPNTSTISGILTNISAGVNKMSILLLDVYDEDSNGSYSKNEWKVVDIKNTGSLSNGKSYSYSFMIEKLEENHQYIIAVGIKTINSKTGATSFSIYEATGTNGEIDIDGVDNSTNSLSITR
jgi:hypothetical protein